MESLVTDEQLKFGHNQKLMSFLETCPLSREFSYRRTSEVRLELKIDVSLRKVCHVPSEDSTLIITRK